MAKRKSSQSAADTNVDVQEVQASSRPFWETNQHLILYILGGIAVLVMAWWGYKALIVEPQQKEAVSAAWQAQLQFDRDSFQLALDNPGGGFDGFKAIAEKYSSTPAGNSAKYYAGLCYLHLGDFDNAISYLEDFDAEGELLPIMKLGVLGDCYSEKKDFAKALEYYEKATNAGKNDLLVGYYLKKLGMLNDYQGNKDAAKEAYERLRRDYPNPNSSDWRDIEKYIYRAGGGQ